MINEEQLNQWQNELDVKKHLTMVHMDFSKYLGTDYKLAKLDDKDREFIITMLSAGMMARDLCPNPDIGKDIQEMDFAYSHAIAILKFNQQGNMIVDRLTDYQNDREEKQSESEYLGRLLSKVKGDIRPKVEDY